MYVLPHNKQLKYLR